MIITNDDEARRAFLKMSDLTNRIMFTSNHEEMAAIEDQIEIIGAAIEEYEDA